MALQTFANGESGLSVRTKVNANFTELYGVTFTPTGELRTITTGSGAAANAKVGENIEATNASANGMYSLRFAFLNKTGAFTSGGNDIADTLIGRYNDVRNGGSAWLRWDVISSPLAVGSGLPGAPTNTQLFAMVARETNPQNRHAAVTWQGESRRFTNGTGGEQMVPETQDFSSLLGSGVRIGYDISFGYLLAKSPYAASNNGRHAGFSNGILVNPNAIAADGAAVFATGLKEFPTAIAIASGGTGYTVGDILTFNTGLDQGANENTQVRVKAVSGGVITQAEIWVSGWYQQSFASTVGVTGGTGSGATFTYTLATDSEAPRAVVGVAGTWDYAIDAASWSGTNCNLGSGRFTGAMLRAPNNTDIVVARNAADNANVTVLKVNSSDKVELAGQRIDTWAEWTPTIAADSGTFTTVTLDAGQTVWQRINGMVFARLAFTVTSIGTASGSFRISGLPVAPASWVDAQGRNDSDGLAMIGSWGGSFVRVSRYDGAAPIANGKAYVIFMQYRV